MKFRIASAVAAILTLAVVFGGSPAEKDQVVFGTLDESNWDDLVPAGKEVDAIYGDLVLKNRHLVAVIAQPLASRHANMTVQSVGGCLIDLTQPGSEGSDQLSAFYPGQRQYPFRKYTVNRADGTVVKPGDGEENRSPSILAQDDWISITTHAAGTDNRPAVDVTWSLAADAPYLTVTTRYRNQTEKPLAITLQDDLRADGGKEDMRKAPNGVASTFWVHDEFWGQAYGFHSRTHKLASNSNSRQTSLRYRDASGQDHVTLPPGGQFELTREIYAGRNLLDVHAVTAQLENRRLSPVELKLQDGMGRGVRHALVRFLQDGQEYGAARSDAGGQLMTSLPKGSYTVQVNSLGSDLGRFDVDVLEGEQSQQFEISLDRFRPGKVIGRITDASGTAIPCKVEFVPQDDSIKLDFGPDTAEEAVGNLRYAYNGEFEQELPAGRYDVVISRGPEYNAVFQEITVPPGGQADLKAKLLRVVKTIGWISSDFHSHSSPSGDNTGSQLGRVFNLVCEHIEFAPCTEHNRISSYSPHIERFGLQPFIGTVEGMELTGRPLPLNHQNVFPLKRVPRTQDGGGPQTDTDPERQMERAALWDDRSEKLVQQNHPDIGWLFYDKNGDGVPDDGHSRSFALMDVVEIHPVPNALRLVPHETLPGRKGNNRVFNWLQLLNQGFRIPGVVNTDAHYNFHGSGWLRNWIASPTDDPAKVQPMDIVHAAEQGRLIMSNGPFLEVSLQPASPKVSALQRQRQAKGNRVGPGEEIEVPGGQVDLSIRVQCPNWFDINHVFVLVNGRKLAEHDYTREKHPIEFRDGVVKFDQTVSFKLKSDAHVIVVAGGEGLELGRVMGPSGGKQNPTALSNPIFVDVDGNGFQANRDTLGAPLPVKFGTRK